MPVGTEREGPNSLQRADVVWLYGGELDEQLSRTIPPGALRVRGQLHPVCWMSGDEELGLDALHGVQVCAFAGIGRPGRFLATLIQLGLEVVHWQAFPDHHEFTEAELDQFRTRAQDYTLVCTEKDRVRLPDSFPAVALRVEMRIEEGQEALREQLKRVVGQ